MILSELIGGPFSDASGKSQLTFDHSPSWLLAAITFNGCGAANPSSKNPDRRRPCLPNTSPQSANSSISTNSSQRDSQAAESFVLPAHEPSGSDWKSTFASNSSPSKENAKKAWFSPTA